MEIWVVWLDLTPQGRRKNRPYGIGLIEVNMETHNETFVGSIGPAYS